MGCGIAAIIAHSYVGGSRCFFVIRTDGTAEDFSVYKCLGQDPKRSERVRAMMRAFPYSRVVRAFRLAPGAAAARARQTA